MAKVATRGMFVYHVELLGHSSLAQLLHTVADVAEAGVVVFRVFLSEIIYVAQGTILSRGREGRCLASEHPGRN